MVDRREAWLRLALTPGLGPKGYSLLLDALCGEGLTPEEFVSLPAAKRDAIWRAIAGPRLARSLPIPATGQVDPLRERLAARDVQWVGAEDAAYPRRLAGDRHALPPPVVFWQGDLSRLDSSPTVGIVGRIDPSPRGRHCARALAARLAAQGWLIVSGLARGIDRAAHQGALEGGGATAAFLPHGILTRAGLDAAMEEGLRSERLLLISAWPTEAPWASSLAVRRNAFIAAAADGLVAAEMTLHSDGTRHTVREARLRGLGVWTFIHPRDPQRPGAAWLIKTGANGLRADETGAVRPKDFEALLDQLKGRRLAGAVPDGVRQLELGL